MSSSLETPTKIRGTRSRNSSCNSDEKHVNIKRQDESSLKKLRSDATSDDELSPVFKLRDQSEDVVRIPPTPTCPREKMDPSNSSANEVDVSIQERKPSSGRKSRKTLAGPIPLDRFSDWLEKAIEDEFGSWQTLERSKQITDGNVVLKSAHVGKQTAWSLAGSSMSKAQYGRSRYSFIEQAMKAVGARPEDSVVDIGSGMGSVVFQIAATFGCRKVIGVELCKGRFDASVKLKPRFDKFMNQSGMSVGEIAFYQGDFRETEHFNQCRNADILFVNNAESVFGARSVVDGSFTLDWHVARAICGMKAGSRAITFEPLIDLEQTNIKDCFERKEHISEKGATSWTETSGKCTRFFTYTKVSDVWSCRRCSFNNPLLRASTNSWGENFQESCIECGDDPAGLKKSYPIRIRRSRIA